MARPPDIRLKAERLRSSSTRVDVAQALRKGCAFEHPTICLDTEKGE
jgi:hypothetical protein